MTRLIRVLAIVAIGVLQACDSSIVLPGQPGDPATGPGPRPGQIPEVASVAVGAHSCALTTSGLVYCWGYNGGGQLGNNDTMFVNPTPIAAAGGHLFQSLSVSKVEDLTCGISTTGDAYCWGENESGQLGDGTTTRRLTPTRVAGDLKFKNIAVGNAHVCAIATSGAAYCWGTSPNGALGDGTRGTHLTPALAAAGTSFQSIASGSDYTCGLSTTGTAYCWGLGVNGQLGNDAASTSATPVAVTGGLIFRSIVAGGSTACGLTAENKAYCWGNSFYGTVGDGTGALEGGLTRHVAPTAVAGGLTFESLSAGFATTCGVTAAGVGYCWGYNLGVVGDGTLDHRSSPSAVAGGLSFRSISSGTGHSCGVSTTNAVYCWGDNSDGELGDGTTVPHETPAPVRWP